MKNLLNIEVTTDAKVFILRGVSGVGKSTITNNILEYEKTAKVVSADSEILEIGNGDYSVGYSTMFNETPAVHIAHLRATNKFIGFVENHEIIIVDNTNIHKSDVKKWVTLALEGGYSEDNVILVDLNTNGFTIEELVERNTHNVPLETITNMYKSITASGRINIKNIYDEDRPMRVSNKNKLIDTLNQLYSDNYLIKHVNNEMGLIIWNYSVKTTYSNYWNQYTKLCRSLVTDFKGNIISRGLPKFFNYNEIKHLYPKTKFIGSRVMEKLDGSYIGIFYYNDKWCVRSKGSFTTDQAIKATELLGKIDLSNFNKGLTHNFEVIYPSNRIVVDYGERERLVYLNSTDKKGNIFVMLDISSNLDKAKHYDVDFDFDNLKSMDDDVNEGFVLLTKDNMLFKVKFDSYIIKHSIVTEVTTYSVWESIVSGKFNEYIELVPDECYNFVKKVSDEITSGVNDLLDNIYGEYRKFANDSLSDKDFALSIKDSKYKSHLFRLRKGLDINMDKIYLDNKPKFRKVNNGDI